MLSCCRDPSTAFQTPSLISSLWSEATFWGLVAEVSPVLGAMPGTEQALGQPLLNDLWLAIQEMVLLPISGDASNVSQCLLSVRYVQGAFLYQLFF